MKASRNPIEHPTHAFILSIAPINIIKLQHQSYHSSDYYPYTNNVCDCKDIISHCNALEAFNLLINCPYLNK